MTPEQTRIDRGVARDYLREAMTNKAVWGQRPGLILAVLGLGLALTRCRSTDSDQPNPGQAGNSGMDAAGTSSAGESAAVAGDAGASSAGLAGQANGGAAGAVEGGAGGAGDGAGASGADPGPSSADAGAGGAPASEALEFVFDRQVLPNNASTFAADLDGDDKPDNAYGRLIAMLSAYGFRAQVSADAETAAGRGLQLLTLALPTTLPTPASATMELWRALPQANPDFKGTGSFVIDSAVPSASFSGEHAQSVVTSLKILPGEKLPQMRFRLPLGGAVELPVSLYSISFHLAPSGLRQGQLNAAALASDVDAVVPPALAAEFSEVCAGPNPPVQPCQTALTLFDTNQDQSITTEELRASSLVNAMLAPDVKLFDSEGKFAPDSAAPAKDAVSIGFGFTAVPARLTH